MKYALVIAFAGLVCFSSAIAQVRTDASRNTEVSPSVAHVAKTASATGSSVDIGGWRTITLLQWCGTLTDGTHSMTWQHSADGSTWSNVAAKSLVGDAVVLSATTQSNSTSVRGYLGAMRYIRALATVQSATTGAIYSGSVIKQRPLFQR